MDVVLPSSGCNIISNSTTFYNYSDNGRTRQTYVIYDGKAFLQSSATSTTGYTYTGTCLTTGDLKYKPELEVYFPVISFCIILLLISLIYKIFIKRLLP